jgi:hypothetical protein
MGLRRHGRVTTRVRPHGSIKKTGTKAATMIPVFSDLQPCPLMPQQLFN